ncbi:unnamed protein product [Protopolystoma xenopodis]|uniref:Uncharacterized protein n=1 Tax=Protopolystoma xenopodis TaxID=117903 RepID=A0A3S5CEC5_9PLAT|nr:unnamed protein product [Protopolystoma xenopodis]
MFGECNYRSHHLLFLGASASSLFFTLSLGLSIKCVWVFSNILSATNQRTRKDPLALSRIGLVSCWRLGHVVVDVDAIEDVKDVDDGLELDDLGEFDNVDDVGDVNDEKDVDNIVGFRLSLCPVNRADMQRTLQKADDRKSRLETRALPGSVRLGSRKGKCVARRLHFRSVLGCVVGGTGRVGRQSKDHLLHSTSEGAGRPNPSAQTFKKARLRPHLRRPNFVLPSSRTRSRRNLVGCRDKIRPESHSCRTTTSIGAGMQLCVTTASRTLETFHAPVL